MKTANMQDITLNKISRTVLIPASGWRDSAKKGVIRMNYQLNGEAVVNGALRTVTITIPAVRENQVCDLGDNFVLGFRPTNEKGLDALQVAVDPVTNKTMVGPDGTPVLAEAPVIMDNGAEYPSFAGCSHLVQTDQARTIVVKGGTLQEADNVDPNTGLRYLRVYPDSYDIVAKPMNFKAQGSALPLKCIEGLVNKVVEAAL